MKVLTYLLNERCLLVFRLNRPLEPERARFPKVGSKFRYPGRTQHQLGGTDDSGRPEPMFRRSTGRKLQAYGPTPTVDTTGL